VEKTRTHDRSAMAAIAPEGQVFEAETRISQSYRRATR
jgi:hypothetical protein